MRFYFFKTQNIKYLLLPNSFYIDKKHTLFVEKWKGKIKKLLPPLLLGIFLLLLAILVYLNHPSDRGYLFTVIITFVVTLSVTVFYDAYKKPYPINRLDHFIKMYMKKSALKGENLVYFRKVTTDCESEREMLDYFNQNKKNGNFTELQKEISKNLGVTNVNKIQDKVTLKIVADLHKKDKVGSKILGKIEVQIIDEKIEDLDEGVSVEFTITFNEWDYKNVKDHLHDASEIVGNVIQLIGKKYNCESAPPVVKFETNTEPAILGYINEMNKDGKENNKTVSINAGKNLIFNFNDNSCQVIGAYSSSDFDKIVQAMTWYV
jgi:hypothetical protein